MIGWLGATFLGVATVVALVGKALSALPGVGQ